MDSQKSINISEEILHHTDHDPHRRESSLSDIILGGQDGIVNVLGIRDIYARKGFKGKLLDKIVDTITANKDVWVAVMMAEEHQLTPIDRKGALRSALIVGVSAIIGSLIPIIPFFFLPLSTSMVVSTIITALVLFIVGAYKAKIYVGNPGKSGLEMAIIGTVSALVGYLIGLLLRIDPS
jgi:predicted membrane protein (TIGR00267 family)